MFIKNNEISECFLALFSNCLLNNTDYSKLILHWQFNENMVDE